MADIIFAGALLIMFLFFGADARTGTHKVAVFAGGCFWCMEPPFQKMDGVIDVVSGYTGGKTEHPTYEQVTSGTTGHFEAVQVVYDPALVSYEELLEVFWRQIDPTDSGGQFADRGTQYHTAIFFADQEQRMAAEKSKAQLNGSGIFDKPVATAILPAVQFYRAEEYHQDYARKNILHYTMYRTGSGREGFLKETWENANGTLFSEKEFIKPSDEQLRVDLSPLQYKVTQKEGTEPPFENDFWDHKEKGIYVDIVSGEPLFSSKDKFDSGTGWPSFFRPIRGADIVEKKDLKFFTIRTEVRSGIADSHLGHVFSDGPEPTGLRYCINSASLRFVPVHELAEKGYGEYLELFKSRSNS